MNYHILTQDQDKKSVSVVYHIPIPATGTNQAGLTWRQALVASLGGSGAITSVVGGITQEELSQLMAGELLEKAETVRFSSVNLTDAERKAQIEAVFTQLSRTTEGSFLANKMIELAWIGYAGNVT